jgi:A/G-specific adenine glycosylase
MELTEEQAERFLDILFAYYDKQGRHDLPWRQTADPYRIVVSELMLQQTQVGRVLPKYRAFLEQFPDVQTLAKSGLGDVLIAWQGLGYNRRAQYLWRAAKQVQAEFKGAFPDTLEALVSLPGIGKNTAGAVLAYAFNKPSLFVETNIRSVVIHHFFKDRGNISDAEILHILEQLQPRTTPRLFYWAMMDYGTHLKQSAGNNIARSKHYVRQSTFSGSRRQLRGAVIRSLSSGPQSEVKLLDTIADERLASVLDDLIREELIVRRDTILKLA